LPTTVKASGTLQTSDGEPLRFVRVVLHPKDQGGVEAFGDVDEKGKFVLTTYKVGDGAVPGNYTVTVDPNQYRTTTGSPAKSEDAARVPARYLEEKTSKMTVEIKAAGDVLNLRLEP
jgi:hypothetical protein